MNLGQMARAEDRHSNHWEEQHFLDTSNLEAGEEAGRLPGREKSVQVEETMEPTSFCLLEGR